MGSHTVHLCAKRGVDVKVYDNLSTGHRAAVPPDVLIEGDIHDQAHLEEVMRSADIEGVIHFAASLDVAESVRDPQKYYYNNVEGTLSVLRAMRSVGVSSIVFSSTAAVYGEPLKTPITEDQTPLPINPYGNSKRAVECLLHDFAGAYGMGAVALRYFNAAGAALDGGLGEAHDPETHLIPLVLQVALGTRSHIKVFGEDYDTPDGSCVRDYVHVDDLAEAHLLALQSLKTNDFRAYNLGSGRGFSVKEVVEACRRITGATIDLEPASRRPGDPPILVASNEKARAELGWNLRFSDIDTIISSAWKWHQSRAN